MVRHEGSSAGSYLADPTSPIPSHCASIVVTSTFRVDLSLYIRYIFCNHSSSWSPPIPVATIWCDFCFTWLIDDLIIYRDWLLYLVVYESCIWSYPRCDKINTHISIPSIRYICLVQVRLRTKKYYAPQVRPDRGLISWPPDHNSTFHMSLRRLL